MSAHALPSPRSGLRRLRPLARRSDDELRALAAGGDAGAFAELYERHHQALYRYCRSIVRHDEDARDALHTTWTNAWAALRAADRDVPVRPWLFRIAHNEAISVLRRRRDHDELDDVAGAASAGGVEDDVALRQRLATLRADLAELPDRQRSALLLRELSGLGHDEIAQVFGITPAAAKQSIYEARRALQEAEEGRSMICADVQRLLSDGDGRVRRGRKVRAHLRGCDACAGFELTLRRRPADIALLAPPLPAAAAAGILARFLAHAGASGHGGGAVATGVAGTSAGSAAAVGGGSGLSTGGASSGLLAAGSKVGAGLAAKVAVGAAIVAGAGAGTVQITTHHADGPRVAPAAAPDSVATPAGAASTTRMAAGAGSTTVTTDAHAAAGPGGHPHAAGRRTRSGATGANRGAGTADHGNARAQRSASGPGRAVAGGVPAQRHASAGSGSQHDAGRATKTPANVRRAHRPTTKSHAKTLHPSKPVHTPKPAASRPATKPTTTSDGTSTPSATKPLAPSQPAADTTQSTTSGTSSDATAPDTSTSSADLGQTSTSPTS